MNQFEKLNLSSADIAAVTNSDCTTSLGTSSEQSTKDRDLDEETMDDEMLHDNQVSNPQSLIAEKLTTMTKHEIMQQLIMKHYFRQQVLD